MTKIVNCYQQKRKASVKPGSLNLRILNTFLFAVVCGLGFAYLIGISDLTVKGFVLQELRAQSASLAEEKRSYEQKINAMQSYYTLSEKAKSLNMVAISDIQYIQAGSHAIAKK